MSVNIHPPATSPAEGESTATPIKVLLVDDEERFRQSLAQRLKLRGLDVLEVGDPEDAIRVVRQSRPDVVVLDRKMPKMQGEEVLKEIKHISPEVQVIMLTGHASMDSAAATGRLDAFAYLEKPCETDTLVQTIQAASQEKKYALARADVPVVEGISILSRLWGTNNSRPGVIALGAILIAALALLPLPTGLVSVLGIAKSADGKDGIAGYSKYHKMKTGETVADYYSRSAERMVKLRGTGGEHERPLSAEETGRKAILMVGILGMSALFWGTGALPIGITALLAGLLMYIFAIFPANMVAQSFAKDAVFFIAGVLAMAQAVSKTGLDRRIGLLLLGTSKSLGLFLFIFCPLLGVSAAFFSEHALVAFIAPILMLVYMSALRTAGLKEDATLATLFILATCFAANQGGPGSPAAGGRNAVMVGILAEYGVAPTFAQWMKYGLPFVPVAELALATYFFLWIRPKVKIKAINVAEIVKKEAAKIGKMTMDEYLAAVTLLIVILLWIFAGDEEGGGLGMGGPVMLGLVLLSIMRIITWRDINRISWDVVALYGSACAIGAGLAATGAALWVAQALVAAFPPFFRQGEGLAMATSLIAGSLTQIMSDGATVSAVGPITVPMAQLSGTHPWMVGLATAFASSFANCFLSGTPNNAIAYSLARDGDTGKQLVTLSAFFKHGLVVTILSFAVLWIWLFYGYWRWIGF